MGNQHAQSSMNGYTKGFIGSLVLTIVPFYFAATKMLPHAVTLVILFTCAIVQVVVHLVYFLHMDRSEKGQWNLLSLVFTGIVVFILIAGSLWIMWNLNHNMMM
ncbi:cytochrome o ubiquinol oxidase subunit IV [Photobacterium profundum]|uniref:cytochrome o ubiquinol oxidase subunit IV n=1 Tax=Photobacterium profundum TaxID=74109 RepID=UPI003D13211E